jgi:hypothetical protein
MFSVYDFLKHLIYLKPGRNLSLINTLSLTKHTGSALLTKMAKMAKMAPGGGSPAPFHQQKDVELDGKAVVRDAKVKATSLLFYFVINNFSAE